MVFLLIWAKSSENRLDDIYNYYCEKAGNNVARKIITGVIPETQKLVKNPFMGSEGISSTRSLQGLPLSFMRKLQGDI